MNKARARLMATAPFWGSLALRLNLVEDTSCETAWTDGASLGYNPAFIAGLTRAQVEGLLVHEVLHVVLKHHLRRASRDPKRWNIACDYAVNLVTQDSGYSLPDGGLLDERFRGMLAEAIYRDQPPQGGNKDPEQNTAQSDPSDGQDDEEGPGSSGDSEDQEDQEGEQDSQGDEGEDSSQGDEEAQEGTQQDAGEEGGDEGEEDPSGCESRSEGLLGASQGWGEVRDFEGTAEEAEEDAANWDMAVIEAEAAASACGTSPAGMQRIVQDIKHPPEDWRNVLRFFVERCARNDYSWRTPNRRYVQQGIYLPTLDSDELREVVIAIDTSGSINTKALEQFRIEVEEILREFRTTARVLYCDTAVYDGGEFAPDEPLEFNPKGFGGTDFCPVFALCEKEALDPACLLYFTDLYCWSFPSTHPEFPVLWVQPKVDWGRGSVPPFGEVVTIDGGER